MASLQPPLYQESVTADGVRRQRFLNENGQQSASAYNYIYGYGAPNAGGSNVSYYQQFVNEEGTHCDLPHLKSRHDQYNQYRGLYARRIAGWNVARTKVTKSCCSSPGSCNGALPYPYGQIHAYSWCDPDYAHTIGCKQSSVDKSYGYTFGNDGPYRYPEEPFVNEYRNWKYPYGERAPEKGTWQGAVQKACCQNQSSMSSAVNM